MFLDTRMAASAHGNGNIVMVTNFLSATHSAVGIRLRSGRNPATFCRALEGRGNGSVNRLCQVVADYRRSPLQNSEFIFSFGGQDVQQLIYCWPCICCFVIGHCTFHEHRSYRAHYRGSIFRITTLVEGTPPSMSLQHFANSCHPKLKNIQSWDQCSCHLYLQVSIFTSHPCFKFHKYLYVQRLNQPGQ